MAEVTGVNLRGRPAQEISPVGEERRGLDYFPQSLSFGVANVTAWGPPTSTSVAAALPELTAVAMRRTYRACTGPKVAACNLPLAGQVPAVALMNVIPSVLVSI